MVICFQVLFCIAITGSTDELSSGGNVMSSTPVSTTLTLPNNLHRLGALIAEVDELIGRSSESTAATTTTASVASSSGQSAPSQNLFGGLWGF